MTDNSDLTENLNAVEICQVHACIHMFICLSFQSSMQEQKGKCKSYFTCL